MDNLMRAIGWIVVGFIGASLINEFLYQLFPLPDEGVSLMKAYVPALGAAVFGGYCAYRGIKSFKKNGRND
jgi:hypothetical protein